MHEVIPEMIITERLNHSITSFIVAGDPKKQNVVSIVFDCIYEINFSKQMNCAFRIYGFYEHLGGINNKKKPGLKKKIILR